MIYASLKPIRQWHTRWTPAAYLVLGLWSGAVLLRAFLSDHGTGPRWYDYVVIALGLIACVVKWMYWKTIDDTADAMTIERAIGVEHGVGPPMSSAGATVMRARLFDSGHTHRTFLTDEFGFTLARRHRSWLRATFWLAGIALPLAWIVFGLPGLLGATISGAACMIGMLAERWLFFAEARHTVRLYQGDRAT